MSQENLEIVRRSFEAFNRRDLSAAVADYAPEYEYVSSGVITDAGTVYRGPEQYKRFVETMFFAEFSEVRAEINELIDTENQVLITQTLHARGRQSGAETSWTFYQVVTFSDGKVTRGQGFAERADALAAVGLSE